MPTAEHGTAKRSFLPSGRSYFVVARHIIEECYDLDRLMGGLADYFDYERYAYDLFRWDYQMGSNNTVFRQM